MPATPGPPGLISSEPIRSRWRASRARTSARSSVWPFAGCCQSSGTLIVAQSYATLAGFLSTTPFHTSGHGFQFAVPTELDGDGDRTCPEVGDAHRALGGMQPPNRATD